MQPALENSNEPAVPLPDRAVADIQDSLLVVMHDLHRLEGLLNHAADNLLDRFGVANQGLSELDVDSSDRP